MSADDKTNAHDYQAMMPGKGFDAPEFKTPEYKAASALFAAHRQRPQQQGFLHADGDRPEADGTAQFAFLDGDKTESRNRVHAFAQPVRRFGEAAGAEARFVQRAH